MSWDQGLDGPARRIAVTDDSPLRVLAGPGTGKTFALMRRVMRLLESGTDPHQILVCTFTRNAARDLQRKLGSLGVSGGDEVWAGTIHSLCFSLLSRAEVLSITGRTPRPLLKFEERFLLEDLRGTNSEGIRDLSKRLNAFSAAWARLQSEMPGWPQAPQDQAFLSVLHPWLRFHSAMLIGELVSETLHFLRNNPTSPHRPSFKQVLVDEYQDLNRAEQVLLDFIAASSSITVVGDEDQSVYSFKYAHPEGIANFDHDHPGTHDESLLECRRCPQRVVAIANSLISHNSSRANRTIHARPSNTSGEVLVVQWSSMNDEAEGIATFIKNRIDDGIVQPGHILVLAPRRQFGYAVRDELNNQSVPAHSFFYEQTLDGNPTIANKCNIQEAFTLLTILARPSDRVAIRCWSGFGSNSLCSGAWARIQAHCEFTGDSPKAVLQKLSDGRLRLPYTTPIVDRFKLLKEHLSALHGLRGPDLLDAIFPSSEDWAEPIRNIASFCGPDADAVELLEIIHRSVTQPELPTDVDYVRVMSLHKSKGLTADLVIITGCIDGLIPTIQPKIPIAQQRRDIEEQRRLFYVAITRTTQTLVLSSVTFLEGHSAYRMGARVTSPGNYVTTISSTFFPELGPQCPIAVRGQDIIRA